MSCANRSARNKGFTLIEIVTVIVVLSILSVFTFSFIDTAVRTYTIGSKQRMLYQEASYAMERVTREVRDAQQVLIFNPGTNSSMLYISPKAHPTGMDSMKAQISFSRNLVNNDLIRLGTTSRIIASNVTQFKIDYENCAVGPFITCSGASPNGVVQITLSLTDLSIPLSDVASRMVTITTKISPKNYLPNTDKYAGRSFNGDYEDDIIQ